MKSLFPPPESGDEDGIVCYSRDLNCELLLDAYWHGIFPWPCNEQTILWTSPKMRGVLPIDKFHIPKSFQRELKKHLFEVRIDTCFDDVIDACAFTERKDEEGTWITASIRREYKRFHRLGYAHSFESFDTDGKLAGGLYGILLNRIFIGESMFFRKSGASKAAFCHCTEVLARHGIELIDTQVITNMTASFGAYEIPIQEYLLRLKELRGNTPVPTSLTAFPPKETP
ncbi:MAG: leucyl/phenylalanyl-tRNA--protein transferase [Victivallales bacterium]|nr:leucyl/phenylalanyl-tRNA--protein transferase [Victivallales bacterium]